MKIIHIIDSLNTGGVNSFVYDLCKAQRDSGDDAMIVVLLQENTDEDNTPIPKEIPALYLCAENKLAAVLKYIPRLRRLLKDISKGEDTVCNLHLKLSVLVGSLASIGLKKIKCVETYHNSYSHYYLEFFLLQPLIKKYITVSKTAQQEMYNRFHAPKEKVIAIPNGIDRNKIRSISKIQNDTKNYIKIISVGRIAYPKNFFIPVEALSQTCNERVRYYVVGDGSEFEKVNKARGDNPYIIMTGAITREEVLQHLASSDLLIMSSLWEGRSILQLEAMAFDVPMIISDVAGLRETFSAEPLNTFETWRRCSFGYLVKSDDIEAYRNAVEDYLGHPELRKEMQEVVRLFSEKNDSKFTVENYRTVYESVLYT